MGTGTQVLLGLGSNIDAPLRQLSHSVKRLRSVIGDVAMSSVYRSAPVGHTDQPDFYNVVISGIAEGEPNDLLAATRSIEHELGRDRPFPNAPRTIDIDILAFGDRILDTPELVIPHPRLHLRAFVLVPLAEIAPDWRHPVLGATAGELLAKGGPFEKIEHVGGLDDVEGRVIRT